MRVNVYAEEMTNRLQIISKDIDGHKFTGLRFYLELPATVKGKQYQGPFMHHPGDDDSSAVTFWGKRDLRTLLTQAQQLLDQHYDKTPAVQTTAPPRIGQLWAAEGGIYAGIVAGRDGQPDYHLVVATEEHELQDVEWGSYGTKIPGADSYFDGRANTAAMVVADLDLGKSIYALQIDGHADYYLPSQAEMHLLAANLKDQFNQDDWYWTSTQYSANFAWTQSFGYGDQDYDYKSSEGRARAVRRLPL